MKDLERFVTAQNYQSSFSPNSTYQTALEEIRRGCKQSHWMWFIYPQIQGLGHSPTARYYALDDLAEARAYLAHPVLRARLLEMCHAALSTPSNDAVMVFGSPDNYKLCSSMTLFEQAEPSNPIFAQVLDKFFHGRRDGLTLDILRRQREA